MTVTNVVPKKATLKRKSQHNMRTTRTTSRSTSRRLRRRTKNTVEQLQIRRARLYLPANTRNEKTAIYLTSIRYRMKTWRPRRRQLLAYPGENTLHE